MVKATIELPERENRILNVVKGQHGFKNRDQALIFLIRKYEQGLEPELRPEYVKKLIQIDKQKGIPFKDIDDLRRQIEG